MPTSWNWPNSLATRIVDADTFDANVTRDLGFGGSCTFPIRLRLNRVNAPPAHTEAGKQATARASELMLVGPVLRITTYRTYKYGGGEVPEWMAEVTLPDSRNVSDVLVAEGLAVLWARWLRSLRARSVLSAAAPLNQVSLAARSRAVGSGSRGTRA